MVPEKKTYDISVVKNSGEDTEVVEERRRFG